MYTFSQELYRKTIYHYKNCHISPLVCVLCEPLEFRLILLVLRPDGNLSYLFISKQLVFFLAPIVTESGPCPSSIVIQIYI